MELQTYRLNPSHPDHVQRSRPKARLRVEMPASMPARKFRSFLYTQVLFAMSRDGEAPLLGKDGILDPVFFRKGKVLLRGEAAVRGHLPGHPAIPGLVLRKEGLVLIGVGGVAPHDEAAEDHGRGAAGEEDLVPVFGIPSLLDDDVRVVLEEGDDLLGGRDLLSLEHAPLGLVDDLAEDAYGPDEPAGELPAGEGVFEGMALVVGELGDGGFGIALHQLRIVQEIPVGLLAYVILLGVEDGHDPLLHHSLMVAELIAGLGSELLALGEPPGDDADAVGKEGRVRGMMDVGLHRGRVDPDRSAFLYLLPRGILQDVPVDGLPRLFRDRLDVLLEDGLRGVLAHLEPGKAPEGIGVLQMEGKLLIRQFPVLLEDGASKHLLGGHPLPAGIGTTCRGEVLEHPVHDRGGGIEDVGDAFELFHDRASHDGGEEVHLGVEFVSHSWMSS